MVMLPEQHPSINGESATSTTRSNILAYDHNETPESDALLGVSKKMPDSMTLKPAHITIDELNERLRGFLIFNSSDSVYPLTDEEYLDDKSPDADIRRYSFVLSLLNLNDKLPSNTLRAVGSVSMPPDQPEDKIPEKSQLERDQVKFVVDSLLAKLTDRQRVIFAERYGLMGENSHTYPELSSLHGGRSADSVRITHNRALVKMRKNVAELLKDYESDNPSVSKLTWLEEKLRTEQQSRPIVDVSFDPSKLSTDPAEWIPSTLPPLPHFSLVENKIGMTHGEWLNLALLHMQRFVTMLNARGETAHLRRVMRVLGNESILETLSAESELINASKGKEGLQVAVGGLTYVGVAKVIDRYREKFSKPTKPKSYKRVESSQDRSAFKRSA